MKDQVKQSNTVIIYQEAVLSWVTKMLAEKKITVIAAKHYLKNILKMSDLEIKDYFKKREN